MARVFQESSDRLVGCPHPQRVRPLEREILGPQRFANASYEVIPLPGHVDQGTKPVGAEPCLDRAVHRLESPEAERRIPISLDRVVVIHEIDVEEDEARSIIAETSGDVRTLVQESCHGIVSRTNHRGTVLFDEMASTPVARHPPCGRNT